MKNITVLYGNYGSGKTELALNIALKLKQNMTTWRLWTLT
jgi:DNA replication protein DnaC